MTNRAPISLDIPGLNIRRATPADLARVLAVVHDDDNDDDDNPRQR